MSHFDDACYRCLGADERIADLERQLAAAKSELAGYDGIVHALNESQRDVATVLAQLTAATERAERAEAALRRVAEAPCDERLSCWEGDYDSGHDPRCHAAIAREALEPHEPK